MEQNALVTLALGVGGIIGALLMMLYKYTVIGKMEDMEERFDKRFDKFDTVLQHIHDCLHSADTRIAVLEFEDSRHRGDL